MYSLAHGQLACMGECSCAFKRACVASDRVRGGCATVCISYVDADVE